MPDAVSQATPSMKGVLFDLDGTLLDTMHLIELSFHHAVKTVLGHDCSMDKFNEKLGEPLVVQMGLYASSPEELDALLDTYRVHNAQILESEIRDFAGVKEALEQLKSQGWKLGVVTSKLHEPARANLDIFDMMPLFDCLIGADDAERFKPDPQPIHAGAQALGLDASACFYVGDSPYDIQAGNAAGAVTIAVQWGQHPLERLRASGPTLECATPADMVKLVNSFER